MNCFGSPIGPSSIVTSRRITTSGKRRRSSTADVWLEAGKQGFLGMAVPEEYGGGGNPDFRYNTIVTEETTAGRYSGIGFGLQNDVVAPYLLGWPPRSRSSAGCPNSAPGS